MTEFVLNITGFVQNTTGLGLNMAGYVLNMTNETQPCEHTLAKKYKLGLTKTQVKHTSILFLKKN